MNAHMRSSGQDLGLRAVEDLAAVLEDIGASVTRHASTADVIVDLDGRRLALEVKAVAYATAERVRNLITRSLPASTIPILVSDRITNDARQALRKAGLGWLDRRGHLMIRAPGVLIDRDFDLAFERIDSLPPIAGLAGRAVAYALLTTPDRALPVRRSAAELGVSPAAISNALARLRAGGLIGTDGLPVLPELFWALAEAWDPKRAWLAAAPSPRDPETNSRDLQVAGWCLTGTAAAAKWGAPVAATAGAPDLYVPGPVVVSIAVRRFGAAANPLGAKASITAAPVKMITARRYRPANSRWPLAHPVAVALDLAQDIARGREILPDWNPPKEFTRVW